MSGDGAAGGATGATGATAPQARPSGARDAGRPAAVQEFFSIGEVCALTDLKPHVLRYWESQFRVLSPAKNRSGNRVYQRREVELVMLVKRLLYEEKYTIEGARQRLGELRRTKALREEAAGAFRAQTAAELERELQQVLEILDGAIAPDPDPPHSD